MAKNQTKNWDEIIHNITKRHWIWYSIVVLFPTIWFTFVVPFLGNYLHIKNKEGEYTVGGIVSSAIVILVSVTITIINNRYASKSEFGELETLKGNIEFLEKITESVDSICDEKSIQLRRIIHQVKGGNKTSPDIISNPSNQLKKILEQISVCLVTFMEKSDEKYYFKDFFVTLAYNFPEEDNNWVWLEGTIERGVSLRELTAPDNKTTFNYLRTSQKTYYFNNRKEDAKKEDRYMYDSFDSTNAEDGKPVGSIFCYSFKIRQSDVLYVDAILSISTQQKRFAEDKDAEKIKNAKDNLITLVKDYFGRRISIELSLLYLDYINRKKS